MRDSLPLSARIRAAQARLAEAGVDNPGLDARLLIAHALGMDRAALLTQGERLLSAREEAGIETLIARREAREPVARILGLREFWSLPFALNEATLEPRPDSETLIEIALRLLRHRACPPLEDIPILRENPGSVMSDSRGAIPLREGLGERLVTQETKPQDYGENPSPNPSRKGRGILRRCLFSWGHPSERPPAKAGGFKFRLEAGSVGPKGRQRHQTTPLPLREGMGEGLVTQEPGRRITERNSKPTAEKTAPLRFLDLGTGTGCLLLSLLHEQPHATGLGVDLAPRAVAQAAANAERLGLQNRARFQVGNWLEGLQEPFDLIVSNPPYIPRTDIETLEPEVKNFDPRAALDGGPDGLEPYRKLIPDLPRFLKPGGILLFEVGYGQALAVAELMRERGFSPIARHQDLGAIERCVTGIWPAAAQPLY